jgi:hypothetical protein
MFQCRICARRDRHQIERVMLAGRATSEIAAKYNLSRATVAAHGKHLPGYRKPRDRKLPPGPRPRMPNISDDASPLDRARRMVRYHELHFTWSCGGDDAGIAASSAQLLRWSTKLEKILRVGRVITVRQVLAHPAFVEVFAVMRRCFHEAGRSETFATIERDLNALADETPQTA